MSFAGLGVNSTGWI